MAELIRQKLSFSLPWCVPTVQPIELFFFQRVFHALCEQQMVQKPEDNDDPLQMSSVPEIEEEQEVPTVVFQRAFVRLFRIIQDDRTLEADEYDRNRNGKVGWFEFCSLWKEGGEKGIHVRLTLAERIFLTLEDGERSILGKIWSFLIFLAILASTGSFIVSTLPEMQEQCPQFETPEYDELCLPRPKEFFRTIDMICAILFTVEYVIRLVLSAFMRTELVDVDKALLLKWMVSDEVIDIPSRCRRVAGWVLTFSNIIDLAAIIPWYLSEIMDSTVDGHMHNENVLLKILRLTRVIRAFRLGRRFEAVIIIVRSVRRSLRALYVLVLNLFLGMIIFGALMYFAEQGTWNPERQAYERIKDGEPQRSPFESIPSCFWWAIVTATTVGYGDVHTPATASGKIVAGLTMVWSLCALALPIGVIGGNFTQVWEEYDSMKKNEELRRYNEDMMLKRSSAWGDPLHYSKRLLLELWHDSGLQQSGQHCEWQSEFMGEVDFTLRLEQDQPERRRCRLPLTQNLEKAKRKVSGHLTFEYHWEPQAKAGPETLLLGCLEVNVVKAECILNIDWKGTGISDPYCRVIAYPNSPNQDGTISSESHRTRTIFDTTTPKWDETVSFDFCWKRGISKDALEAGMRLISREISGMKPVTSPDGTGSRELGDASHPVSSLRSKGRHGTQGDVLNIVPELQREVDRLRNVMPELQEEIIEVEKDMQCILYALKCRRPQYKPEMVQWRTAPDVADASVELLPVGQLRDSSSLSEQPLSEQPLSEAPQMW